MHGVIHALSATPDRALHVEEAIRPSDRIAAQSCEGALMRYPRLPFYVHILRSDDDVRRNVRYILENPCRKGIEEDWRKYPYLFLLTEIVY